jgi:hypothetical protein
MHHERLVLEDNLKNLLKRPELKEDIPLLLERKK